MDRQDILAAALELQQDSGLMASNLLVLNQYVTSLHHMSTEVLHLVFGQELFPSQAVDEVAPLPRVQHASSQMAAMGLWCPPVGPGGPGLDMVFHSDDCPGCTSSHRDYPVKHLQLVWSSATCSVQREHS